MVNRSDHVERLLRQVVVQAVENLAEAAHGFGRRNILALQTVKLLGHKHRLAEEALDRCGITINKNMIPYDERKPVDPSGIRIGTPALSTRGMGPDEMRRIGAWMIAALRSPEDEALLNKVRGEIRDLCAQFPVPAATIKD